MLDKNICYSEYTVGRGRGEKVELCVLVEEAKAGNQAAMGALYQETSQRVYALALRLTGNPDQAMDVVQGSYLSAIEHLDSLRNPNAFMSWMFSS